MPSGEYTVNNGEVTAEEAIQNARHWEAHGAEFGNSEEDIRYWASHWRRYAAGTLNAEPIRVDVIGDSDPGFVDQAIDIATDVIDLSRNIPAVGGSSINDFVSAADTITSGLQYGINWLQSGYNDWRDTSSFQSPILYSTDFTVAAVSTIGQGIAAVPSALAHPWDSTKSFFVGTVRTIDTVLEAEETPTLVHLANGRNYVSNASGRELATLAGTGTGGGATTLAPTRLLGRARAGGYGLTPSTITPIDRNSLSYIGDTHVYAIRRADGTVAKIGESAQGVRPDGMSIRGESQARRLTRETGIVHRSEIRANFGGKAPARAYETRFIETLRRLYGDDALPLNRTNR